MSRWLVGLLLVVGCGDNTAPVAGDDMATPASSCNDGRRNGDETDVDCGGACGANCAEGKACLKAIDCQSKTCLNNACIPMPGTCVDGKANGSESDVDCGGACPRCTDGKACRVPADCASATCLNLVCVPMAPSCSDASKNGMETDVDCGGPTCPKCADGKICIANSDCTGGTCTSGICGLPPGGCGDQVRNGMETDVDCGGPTCGKCALGKACVAAADCASNNCQNMLCAAAQMGSCANSVKDGMETDVDCGGPTCAKCGFGKKCSGNDDCITSNCQNMACAAPAPTCNDGSKNGMETDVDCGGPMCGKCGVGKACSVAGDCGSGLCMNSVCVAVAACNDAMKNGAETDVDCGGAQCPKCALGKHCALDGDCSSGACGGGACVNAPSCSDLARNGMETDVDCGGPMCPKCANGKACGVPGDCGSGACLNGLCVSSCADTQKDGMETDVDCGGGQCPTCANGKKCGMAADCTGGACNAGMCANAANCMDQVKNGLETDVDCGGPMCGKCTNGKGCSLGSDCGSGVCTANVCAAPPTCVDNMKNGQESDVDCGGGTCAHCALGKRCNGAADCATGACANAVCVAAPTCMDQAKDGLESDVDCGGPACAQCAVGKACLAAADCTSYLCTGNVCAPPGNNCGDAIKDGMETDVDCGGAQCGRCPAGKTCLVGADCQSAVCSGGACQAVSCADAVKNGMESDVDCGGPICPRCPTSKACMAGTDCVSGFCAGGACGPLFSAATLPAAAAGGMSVWVSDLNFDNKADVIIGGASVSVLSGAGNGTFSNVAMTATGGAPDCVTANFNGDNLPDVACANAASGVSLYLSNGNALGGETLVATGGMSQSIAMSDVNMDGKPDLVTADFPNNRVNVLLGLGAGKFAAAVNYPTGQGPASVVVADMNQDGKPDIVVANSSANSNSVSLLTGVGNGTFNAQTSFAVGQRPRSIAVDDLDGDGKLDIVVANAGDLSVGVLLGTGAGKFAGQVVTNGVPFNLSISARALVIGDFNGDGVKDIVAAAPAASVAAYLRGKGAGKFLAPISFPVGNNSAPLGVGAGDFNGDGKLDLAFSTNTPAAAILLNLFQ